MKTPATPAATAAAETGLPEVMIAAARQTGLLQPLAVGVVIILIVFLAALLIGNPEHVGPAIVTGLDYSDLLVETRRGMHKPVTAMVDVTHIEGLGEISLEDDYIVIGCGVTHSQIVADERIVERGSCLAESCGVIGGPQVRNTGTLAGNVAHALPAGDGTIGLLALGGEVDRDGPRHQRELVVDGARRRREPDAHLATGVADDQVDELLRQTEPKAHDAWQTKVDEGGVSPAAPEVAKAIVEPADGVVAGPALEVTLDPCKPTPPRNPTAATPSPGARFAWSQRSSLPTWPSSWLWPTAVRAPSPS